MATSQMNENHSWMSGHMGRKSSRVFRNLDKKRIHDLQNIRARTKKLARKEETDGRGKEVN